MTHCNLSPLIKTCRFRLDTPTLDLPVEFSGIEDPHRIKDRSSDTQSDLGVCIEIDMNVSLT